MYIQIKIWQLPSKTVWSIQATLYDSDWVKIKDLKISNDLKQILESIKIDIPLTFTIDNNE